MQTIMNQTRRARMVVESYIHYATDPALKSELVIFLQSLPKSENTQ